jgi:hypothetical protein
METSEVEIERSKEKGRNSKVWMVGLGWSARDGGLLGMVVCSGWLFSRDGRVIDGKDSRIGIYGRND